MNSETNIRNSDNQGNILEDFPASNPLGLSRKIVGINAVNPERTTANKLFAGYNNYVKKHTGAVDYQSLVEIISSAIKHKTNINELFSSLHYVFTNKLSTMFTALGRYNPQTKCINLKVIDKISSTYTSKVFLSDDENPITQAFSIQQNIVTEDNGFLNIPYLPDSKCIVIPMFQSAEGVGVVVLGDNEYKENMPLYEFVANYLSVFIKNKDLEQRALNTSNNDALTGLFNHRTFQEKLTKELVKSGQNAKPLSIIIFDVNNISTINKELGHSKGDEIIKTVAEKISQNIRSNDFAGRYGGDEIVVVMPDTDTGEAKYLAEYLTYSLSCTLIDDVGTIKVSVGIANYPSCAAEQEKLLILAEQAMYISKSKGYQNGISTIVSSEDFDFWDDTALNSFASIIAKRHASIGINFEEELINKFMNEDIISQNHLIDVVTSLASAIDAKDEYTRGHSTSVSRYSEALARALNLPEKEVERIKLGALLHDVGKIGIPENVLRKPTHLSDEEWEIMKQHPAIGAEKVLLPNKALHDLIPIVKHHHEHWDGTGYPDKLKGEEIPYPARIVSIADAFHALISDRPYRKGLGVDKACEILKMGADIQWEAEMVRTFIQIAPSLSTKI